VISLAKEIIQFGKVTVIDPTNNHQLLIYVQPDHPPSSTLTEFQKLH